MTCPASPAQNAESGSSIGQVLPTLAPEDLLIHLIDALNAQSQAIQALAESNMALVQAMAQDQGMDEGQEPRQYLDGSPVR